MKLGSLVDHWVGPLGHSIFSLMEFQEDHTQFFVFFRRALWASLVQLLGARFRYIKATNLNKGSLTVVWLLGYQGYTK